jgi:hypothetical protein
VAALDRAQYIPAAAFAEGAEGSFYQTDVDLSNAGDQAVEYQIMWLPRGEDNSDPTTSATFTLGAGRSVRYANVLSEVFNLEPNSLGAIVILSTSEDLLAMGRIYNTPSTVTAGTFGQAMPAVAASDFIPLSEVRRILFASEHADLRTNIGCQNASGGAIEVLVGMSAADGTGLAGELLTIEPWGNEQLNRVFEPHQPVDGYVEIVLLEAETSNAKFFCCYGSVLDNVTSDPTTIFPQ